MSALVQRIQREFEEAPGLAITVEKGVTILGARCATCERVLTDPQAAEFLVQSADGHFRRRPTM